MQRWAKRKWSERGGVGERERWRERGGEIGRGRERKMEGERWRERKGEGKREWGGAVCKTAGRLHKR